MLKGRGRYCSPKEYDYYQDERSRQVVESRRRTELPQLMCLLDEKHPERQAAAVPIGITAVKKSGELIVANAVIFQFWPEIPRHEPYPCVIALRDGHVQFEESSYLSLAKVAMMEAYLRDEATDRQSARERMTALLKPTLATEAAPIALPRRPEMIPL